MWGCFLMSGVKILHILKDWWKSIPIHQNYTMALSKQNLPKQCFSPISEKFVMYDYYNHFQYIEILNCMSPR